MSLILMPYIILLNLLKQKVELTSLIILMYLFFFSEKYFDVHAVCNQ